MNKFDKLDGWRNVAAPDSLEKKVMARVAKGNGNRVVKASLVLVGIGLMACVLMAPRTTTASTLYARVKRASQSVVKWHMVAYSVTDPNGVPRFEWSDTWISGQKMRRDGLRGHRFFRDSEAMWAWNSESHRIVRADYVGEHEAKSLPKLADWIPSSAKVLKDGGTTNWNGRELQLMIPSGETIDHMPQRWYCWVDSKTDLLVYMESDHQNDDGSWSLLERAWLFYDDPTPSELFNSENLVKSAEEIQPGLTKHDLPYPPRP